MWSSVVSSPKRVMRALTSFRRGTKKTSQMYLFVSENEISSPTDRGGKLTTCRHFRAFGRPEGFGQLAKIKIESSASELNENSNSRFVLFTRRGFVPNREGE